MSYRPISFGLLDIGSRIVDGKRAMISEGFDNQFGAKGYLISGSGARGHKHLVQGRCRP